MAKYIWHNGTWCEAVRRTPQPGVAPFVIRDTMSVGYHPATGQATDSKSTWRRLNREHGFLEMGTDAPTEMKPQFTPAVRKEDIAEAIQMLEQGYQPAPVEKIDAGDFASAEVRTL